MGLNSSIDWANPSMSSVLGVFVEPTVQGSLPSPPKFGASWSWRLAWAPGLLIISNSCAFRSNRSVVPTVDVSEGPGMTALG